MLTHPHFPQPLRWAFLLILALTSTTVFSQLNVDVTGTNISCFGLSNGTASAQVSNATPPLTYAWSNGGSTATITNLNAGTYSVTVTDANGATGTDNITLTQPTRVTATITTPQQCAGPYTIAAEPQGGVVPYTYNWSTGADTRGVTVPAGDYSVTVVDANLCGYVAYITINDNPPTVTLLDVDAQCDGSNDGAITATPAGGVAPYTYAWSNGQVGQTITGLAPGPYRVTLTDSRGCTATATTLIQEPAAITGNIFGDATVCTGVIDAFIRIAPSGGTPPYSYNWSPGNFGGQGIGPLGPGTYSVTVTDANECTLVDTYVITESAPVQIQITGDLLVCGAGSTGTLSASPLSGPVSQYTYLWSTGATTPSITGAGAGTYTVTATDVNGCTGTAMATVRSIDLNVTLSSTPLTCAGANDGTATATASGGDQPYTYQWSNGATTATISGLAAGVYGVTVTEANNCKVSGSVQVSAPNPLMIAATPTNVVCNGEANGSINVTVSGGTPAYTFLWSDGQTTEDRTGLTAGTYGVTVTDANGCVANTSVVISQPTPLVVDENITNVACNGDASGSIVLTASGGTPAYTYVWSDGASGRIRNNLAAGNYTVTVTDARGCNMVATYPITQPTAIVLSGVPTSLLCFGGNTGAVNLSVTGGASAYSYRWSNGATTEDLSGLSAGTYTVTVTDANECTATATFTITQPTRLVLTATPANVVCNGEANGSINVTVSGGTPAYTFLWSDGQTTEDRTGLTAGTYGVTVTDANGCIANTSVVISQPTPLVLDENITNVACNGDTSGSIVLTANGGTPAYTYVWSDGASGRIRNNLAAGNYTVTVTDARGCNMVATYPVTQPTAIALSGVPTNLLCFGDNNGSVNLSVMGGSPAYIYRWSNGANTEDINGLSAGTYSVTVTDANDCTATATFTVTQPADLALSATPANVLCGGGNDGAINVTTSGGTQPYTYRWSNGATTEDLTGLTAGTYMLTVTDANNCTETVSVTISQPLALNGFAQITPVACQGEATGAINLTAERGTPPYTFLWNTGAVTEDISGLTAGNYTITVTDANNCTLVQIYTVGTVNPIFVSGVVDNVDCNAESTGGVNLSVSGGSGTYAYMWSNGAITEDITNVPAGTYVVTVTDSNECSEIASFTVTEPAEINLSITNPDIVCGGTNSGSITVFPAGGTAPYTYRWSNGATGNMVNNIPAGSYSVTVTDANGCTDVTSGIVLGELPALTCEVIVDQESTDGTNGALSVNVDGGTQPYTYQWSNGATTPTISGLGAGTYSVTVTDFSGCTTQCTGTLRALSGLGNFVWEDWNVNGQQDPGEPGIFDYPVYLKNAAGVIIDSTRTDADGFYSFMGLEPGTYSVLFPEPPGGVRTIANTGNDATDSDGDPAMNGMTGQYTLAPGEFNMTVDAGFFAEPNGAITDPCNCLNNNTTDFDGQLLEKLEIIANVGQTWRIIARTFMYDINSPAPPAAPILLPIGTTIPQVEVLADPSMARYALDFLLVDSFTYSVTLSNGAFEFTFTNQCFYPEVRFSEVPPEVICRFEDVFALDAFGRLNGIELPGTATFTINGIPATSIDPMALPLGENIIEGTFTPDDPDECIPSIERQVIIIDECPAKLGDFVWQDTNGNGQQDPGEPGIEGVKVTVTSQDGTYMDMAFTDEMGMYMFSVPPGTYKITFAAPDGYLPTTGNTGNDATDSDIEGSMMMTGFYTVGPDEMNFTIDAGFIVPCIANIVNPGTIGFSQEVCGPGNVPQPFVEIAPATGGQGNIEYLWMSNVINPNQDIVFWQALPNSNSPNYAPGPVNQTTYFTRCVRRDNCNYLESNVITVEVGTDAVAEVSGPRVVCVGEDAIFQAVNPGNGAIISWNFTGSSVVESAAGPTVTTRWVTFGSFSVTLTVTANGCTSTQVFNVAVVNNPNRCGGNLTANGAINNLQSRDVTIEWEVPYDGSEYTFSLERSTNGSDFSPIADVNVPTFVSGNDMAMYRQGDVSPLAGRTFYRVRMMDPVYDDMLSNVVELQLAGASSALGRIYPNPASNGMVHVEMTEEADAAGDASVQLFDVRGNAVGGRFFVQPGTGVLNIPAANLPAGVYFMRLTVEGQTETHRVIIN